MGEIASKFDEPSCIRLGHCQLIEEIMIGEDKAIRFSGVQKGEACTIVLRGASIQTLNEAERSLHDAFCVLVTVLRDPRFLHGGGNPEMQMATTVEKMAAFTIGKISSAMQSFARALQKIPESICENAGLDSTDLLSTLRAAHLQMENCNLGVDVILGKTGDM